MIEPTAILIRKLGASMEGSCMGVFEKPKGSGTWWVNYHSHGKRHREKVGTKENAKKLYIKRKAEALASEKMPELRKKRVLFGELIDDAIEYARANNKQFEHYASKGRRVRKALGDREVNSITPQDLSRWLDTNVKSGGTFNRYRAFLSLCFREGQANGKVRVNPARMVRQKRESPGRLRYLTRSEAAQLERVIAENHPRHLNAYLVALHTGIRQSEQYTLTWAQVHLTRAVIELRETKNRTARTIPLNSTALDAIRRQRELVPMSSAVVFPRTAKSFDTRLWFHPALNAAEIEDFTWHGLRHTFCSWCVMAGLSLKTVQELAGHKTISMTSRYSHLSDEHKRIEIERIAGTPKTDKVNQTATDPDTRGRLLRFPSALGSDESMA